jgi:hypothetical protein
MEERHLQSGGMPASFRPSPKRRPGHGPGSNIGSERDIGSRHNRQDGNSNLGNLRLRSLSPPDSPTLGLAQVAKQTGTDTITTETIRGRPTTTDTRPRSGDPEDIPLTIRRKAVAHPSSPSPV